MNRQRTAVSPEMVAQRQAAEREATTATQTALTQRTKSLKNYMNPRISVATSRAASRLSLAS